MDIGKVRSVPLFASLDNEAAARLCEFLSSKEYPAETTVFRNREIGDSMYLVDTGKVRISITDADGHTVKLADLGPGDFFGEMSMLDRRGRSADATVIENARLARLTRQDFLSFLESDPRIALEMLTALTQRLRRTDELLRHRVSRNVNEEEAARMTFADRAADALAEFGGSWKFIIAAIGIIVGWIVFNSIIMIRGFDPAPYQMLNLVMGIIAGLQAPIIMMSQNRQSQKDRLRADLDYQLNLKNEILLGEIVQRLEELAKKKSHDGAP